MLHFFIVRFARNDICPELESNLVNLHMRPVKTKTEYFRKYTARNVAFSCYPILLVLGLFKIKN